MKKIASIALIALANFTFAQIPNLSFENWTTVGSYSIPDGWGTMNNTTASYSVATATKGTPGNPGNFYLKLTSLTTGTAVTNGIAVSGKLDTLNKKPKSGFPYSLQPISLTGRWQHMIYGTSQGSVRAVLTKWNIGLNKRDTIAIAAQTLSGMAMSWANFTINFTYYSTNVPDSCLIELKASGTAPTNNDYLWVDNLAFTGSVAGIGDYTSFLNNVIVYPNPSSEQIDFDINLKSPQHISIELRDVTGKLISTKNLGTIEGQSKQTVDVRGISKGSYFIRIVSDSGAEVKRVVIE